MPPSNVGISWTFNHSRRPTVVAAVRMSTRGHVSVRIGTPKSGRERKVPLTPLEDSDQAIKHLGHSTLTMSLRYMHLAPSALTEAIGLLNFGQPVGSAESAAV